MKKLSLIYFIVQVLLVDVSANCVQAQIILSQASYTRSFPNTTDTVLASNVTTFPGFPASANASWDLAPLVSSHLFGLYHHIAPDLAAFPLATYADSMAHLSIGTSLNVPVSMQNGITDTAWAKYGFYTKKLIDPVSATDTLTLDSQATAFSSPQVVLHFPATYHATWTSDFIQRVNTHLTIASLSLANAPAYILSHYTVTDSVVGWGQMKVLTLDSTVSGYMNVLQVREYQVHVDSFFVNGLPADSAVYDYLADTPGTIFISLYEYYYRVNEVTPLATLGFLDLTFTTPVVAFTHAQRLASPTSVLNVTNEPGISVYPNPLGNTAISIDMGHVQNGNWSYNIIDMNGKEVSSGILSFANSSIARLNVPAGIENGIYYIRMSDNDKMNIVRALDINR